MSAPEEREPGLEQEPDGMDAPRVALVAVVAVLVALIAGAWAALQVRAQQGTLRGAREGATGQSPRERGLVEQTALGDDDYGPRTHAAQRARLERWGWVDAEHTLVRVPIDRAIELYLRRAAQPAEREGAR